MNLVRSEAELPQIEDELKADPVIAYRLLRYVNCAAAGHWRGHATPSCGATDPTCPLLLLAEAVEKADEGRIDTIHRGLRIDIETVHDTYSDALAWAEKLL